LTIELNKLLGMNKTETRAMYSLEHWLIRLDIKNTTENDIADRKTKWIQKWESSIFEKTFFGLIGENPPKSEIETIKKLKTNIDDPKKLFLVFSEALVFAPYFNIQLKESSHLQETLDEANREQWEENVFKIANKAGLNIDSLKKWKEDYLDALKAIAGRSEILSKIAIVALASVALGVTGGVAAPAIGGIVGGMMGLSGAAATSAGLAFLGGGAIAAGGFGMTGGTIALIGGGAILGGMSSWVTTRAFFLQHKLILAQLAKIEATLKTIKENSPEFRATLNFVQEQQIITIQSLTQELASENLDGKDRKALEKTKSYYENAKKRLDGLRG